MKNKRIYILITTIALLMASPSLFASAQKEVQYDTSAQEAQAKYRKISSKDAKEAFDFQDDITIVDVRTEGEFNSGHIADAINIPLDVVVDSVLEKFPNKDEKLYLYCRSGNRSSQAARLLVKQGYTNVYDFGGVNNWSYGLVN